MSAWDLFIAVKDGNVSETKKLVQAMNVDVQAADWDERQVIHMAAVCANMEILEYLLERGASPNAQDKWGTTPLHEACGNHHEAVALRLLAAGADLSLKNADGRTPLDVAGPALRARLIEASVKSVAWDLFHAAREGNLETIRHLVEGGRVDVNVQDWDDRHVLHLAAEYGHGELARWLLARPGLRVNVQDRWGVSPLHEACKHRRSEIAVELVEHGADMFLPDAADATPLDVADEAMREALVRKLDLRSSALRGDLGPPRPARPAAAFEEALRVRGAAESVRSIVEKGAGSVDDADADGNTLLMYAAMGGHERVVKYLLDQGCHRNTQNNQGETVMHFAAARDHTACLALLVDAGANVNGAARLLLARGAVFNPQEANFRELMRDAVKENKSALFGVLEEAKVRLYDHVLVELLFLACRYNAPAVLEMCIRGGVDINVGEGAEGRRPAHEAAAHGHDSLLRSIIEDHKANLSARDGAGRSALHVAAASRQSRCALPVFAVAAEAAVEGGELLCAATLVDRGAAVTGRTVALIERHVGRAGGARGRGGGGLGEGEEGSRDDTSLVMQRFYAAVLVRAAALGRTAALNILLTNGVDANAADGDGRTALHLAALHGHGEVVRSLLASEALRDPDARDAAGRTALHLAAAAGHAPTVQALVSGGVSVSAAAHHAALHERGEVLRLLAASGALAARAGAGEGGGGGGGGAGRGGGHEPGRELEMVEALEGVARERRRAAVRLVARSSAAYLLFIAMLTALALYGSTGGGEEGYAFGAAVRRAYGLPEQAGGERLAPQRRFLVSERAGPAADGAVGRLFTPAGEGAAEWAAPAGRAERPAGPFDRSRFAPLGAAAAGAGPGDACGVPAPLDAAVARCYPRRMEPPAAARAWGDAEAEAAEAAAAAAGPRLAPLVREAFAWRDGGPRGSRADAAGVAGAEYEPGGFYVDLPAAAGDARAALGALEAGRWLDRGTAAVLLEFAVYNPSLRSLAAVRSVYEFLPTGGVAPRHDVRVGPLRAPDPATPAGAIQVAFELVACAFFAASLLGHARLLPHLPGAKVAGVAANLYDFALHGLLLALATTRALWYGYSAGLPRGAVPPERYVDLQTLAALQSLQNVLAAFAVLAVWLRSLLSLTRLPVAGPLLHALAVVFASAPVLTFLLVCLLVAVTYAVGLSTAFSSSVATLHTFQQALLAVFSSMLKENKMLYTGWPSDADPSSALQAKPLLGSLLFATYLFFATMVLVNLFVAIFTESYSGAIAEGERRWNARTTRDAIRTYPAVASRLEALARLQRAAFKCGARGPTRPLPLCSRPPPPPPPPPLRRRRRPAPGPRGRLRPRRRPAALCRRLRPQRRGAAAAAAGLGRRGPPDAPSSRPSRGLRRSAGAPAAAGPPPEPASLFRRLRGTSPPAPCGSGSGWRRGGVAGRGSRGGLAGPLGAALPAGAGPPSARLLPSDSDSVPDSGSDAGAGRESDGEGRGRRPRARGLGRGAGAGAAAPGAAGAPAGEGAAGAEAAPEVITLDEQIGRAERHLVQMKGALEGRLEEQGARIAEMKLNLERLSFAKHTRAKGLHGRLLGTAAGEKRGLAGLHAACAALREDFGNGAAA
eukprot:tig00021348_g20519.t1